MNVLANSMHAARNLQSIADSEDARCLMRLLDGSAGAIDYHHERSCYKLYGARLLNDYLLHTHV